MPARLHPSEPARDRGEPGVELPDHTRAAGRRARQIASKLRLRGAQAKDEAKRAIAQATSALARLAETSAHDAEAVLRNARRVLRAATGRRAGQLRRAVTELAATINVTAVVVGQARSRLAGIMPDSATRWSASMTVTPARSCAAGSASRSQFGYKAQVVDNADGVIVDYTVEPGNRPTPRNSRRPSPASPTGPAGHPAP